MKRATQPAGNVVVRRLILTIRLRQFILQCGIRKSHRSAVPGWIASYRRSINRLTFSGEFSRTRIQIRFDLVWHSAINIRSNFRWKFKLLAENKSEGSDEPIHESTIFS